MVRLRRIEPCDGLLLKRVRLAALEDSPDAFSSTFAREAAFTDEEWTARAEAGSTGVWRLTVFAEGEEGVVGLAGGFRRTNASATVELVSMWVAPTQRRTGVGRDLALAVIDWARRSGAREVALGVTDGNVAAERLYTAMGFAPTGTSVPLASNPSLIERRMATPLA